MYSFFVSILNVIVRLIFGIQIEGAENIPAQGGAIIAANHATLLDPVAVACAVDRPIHFMAKEQLFKYPILKQLFLSVNAFPVKRGTPDRNAIRTAIEIVDTEGLLGIFPEGTRNKGNDMLPIQGGTAMIAIKSGVPVVPVVVTGFRGARFRKPIKVRIGAPIHLGGPKRVTKKDVQEASLMISRQFSELLRRNIV